MGEIISNFRFQVEKLNLKLLENFYFTFISIK